MFALDVQEKLADKAVVVEFGSVLKLRSDLVDLLSEHNLTTESLDSIVAHSLSAVLVRNFCIASQEADRHPYLSLSNSTIAQVKYIVEPLCQWFVVANQLVEQFYRLVPGGDMFVTVRASGARIVFIVSASQRRLY